MNWERLNEFGEWLVIGACAIVVLLLLSGCSRQSGLLTGDTNATGWVKQYCFDGNAHVTGNAPFAGGGTTGALRSKGVVWYSDDAPEAAIVVMSKTDCHAQD